MDNKNKKPRSLYAMWLEAHKMNALPAEWKLAHNFLTWATTNGYKPEYGYEGEFTPDNLLAAKSKSQEVYAGVDFGRGKDATSIDGEIIPNAPEKKKEDPRDVENLIKTMNKDALIKLAQETPGVAISGTETKRQLAEFIVAAEKKSGDSK